VGAKVKDDEGKFEIAGVTPGEYRLYAIDEDEYGTRSRRFALPIATLKA